MLLPLDVFTLLVTLIAESVPVLNPVAEAVRVIVFELPEKLTLNEYVPSRPVVTGRVPLLQFDVHVTMAPESEHRCYCFSLNRLL